MIPETKGWLGRADTLTGLVCAGLGAAILWLGADYAQGHAGRIGPGYAPRLLALLLIGLAALLLARAIWSRARAETAGSVRAVGLIIGAVLAFSQVLPSAGLVPAILASVAIGAFATPDNGWRTAVVAGLVLAAFSSALFVKGLKLPIPLLRLPVDLL